jgi:hypothetical protein
MEREVKVLPQWEKKLGIDVARFGDDRTVFTVRQMGKVLRKEVMSKLDTMSTTGKGLAIAKEEYIKAHNIFVDGVGMGAGVVDRFKEQGWEVNDVNTGAKAEDEEHYGNLRAELAGKVKEWLKTGQLPRDDDYYEMANIKYKFNSKGQIMLEKKEDMKKRELPSPDVFDSLCLTFAGASRGRVYHKEATEQPQPYYPEVGF